MRILQVGPVPADIGGNTFGGVATHVWDLSRHLAEQGHSVAILADNFHSPAALPVVEKGVNIYGFCNRLVFKCLFKGSLHLSHIYLLKKRCQDLITLRWAMAQYCLYDYVLHHFKPDVIHVHHLEIRFPFADFIVKGRVPIVTTIHSLHAITFGHPTLAERYRELVKCNFKRSDNLIFVSKSMKSEFNNYIGELDCHSWVILNPINTSGFYQMDRTEARVKVGLPKKIPVVLFVGSLTKRKGEYTLLEALKILTDSDIYLKAMIIGDGPEARGVDNYIKEKNLFDIVTRIDRLTQEELLLYYNAADLFVLPSTSESFGLVYIESMLCGTPAIGVNATAIPEVIPSKDYGFLVPQEDAKSLANAIKLGFQTHWENEKIIAYAKSFGWNKNIHKFEEIYSEVTCKPSSRKKGR
ncbi:MAG: glycosyltransferase [bacterium]